MQVAPARDLKPWRTCLKRLDNSQLEALYAYFSAYKQHSTNTASTSSTPPQQDNSIEGKRIVILEVIERKLSRGERISLIEEFVDYFEQNGTWDSIKDDVIILEAEERRLSGGLSFRSSLDGLPAGAGGGAATDVTGGTQATATSSSSSSMNCDSNSNVIIDEVAYQVLKRFPTQPCYLTPNVIFYAIFIASIPLAVLTVAISTMLVANLHPMNTSWFAMQHSFFKLSFNVVNSTSIFFHFLIPAEFAYGRAIVHIAFALLNIYIFWKMIPYFRRIENSFYFGAITGRLGCAVGVLISSLVNPTDSSELGLEMMGMTLGIILLCYLVGFITMEVYTRLVFRYVRDVLARNSEREKEAVMIYHIFEEKDRLRFLQMFLRFALRGSHDIADLATSFVKSAAASKSFNDPELLILGAMLAAYRWEDYGYSYAQVLIRRANRANIPYAIRFYLAERSRELEIDQTKDINSGHNFVEIKHIVEKVEKKTEELRSLHKHFWKELINEVPNMGKLDQVNRRMTSLSSDIETTYSNLMTNYSRERQVLRGYATFLENFKFDKDLAHELVQEVAKIEEEESIRVKRKSSGLHIPYNSKRKFESYSIRKSIEERPIQPQADQVDDSFSGVETQRDVSKKESLFRNAIRNGGNSKVILSSLVIFGFFTLTFFLYYLIFGVYISMNAGEHVSSAYYMCKPSTSTIGLLREIRMKQNLNQVMTLFPEAITISPIMVNISLEEHKTRLSEYDSFFKQITKEAQQNRFTRELYEIFTKPDITIFVPSVPKNSGTLDFTTTDQKNVSVFELINIISESATYFKNWKGADYNNTIQSFEFMYVWDNKLIARNSFVKFCESAIAANSDETNQFSFILNVSYGATAGGYLIISIIYLIVTRYQMAEVPHVLNIFKNNLSKNVVGKIYHEMNEKNDDDATTHLPKTSLTRPNNLFFLYGVLVIVSLILVGGLILIESNVNCTDSIQTSLNIKHGTSVLRVIHRASFRVGEYFAYFGLPKTHLNSDYMTTTAELDGFLTDIKSLMAQLFTDWTALVYGSGGSDVSVGKYSTIDRLIQGVSSCSDNSTMDDTELVDLWKNCYGLERMISTFTTDVSKLNEQVYNQNYVKNFANFLNGFLDIFVQTNILSDHLIKFLDLFVENSSSPNFEITGVFGALFCLVCIFLFYSMFNTLQNNHAQLMCLRNMLNYVPVDALDSNEVVRNFILYNAIPSPFSKVFKSKTENPTDENSKVRSVLNSSVEGAFIADENGFVELINPAAQNIFGFQQQSDVVGTPFINIFDTKDHEHIKKIIQTMKDSMKLSNHKNGEVAEVDCVRKNGTQFPAMVNMFIVIFDNSPNLVCFLKDVTSEKKHNAIIAEEKAKSDRLLRNILPESVAARLKSGDTFIAEKFADITCFFSDMVGFTNLSSGLNPNELVGMLNTIVNGFDALTDKYQLEKIKTIGDAYFAVGGIGNTQSDHPERTLRFAISTFDVIKDFNMKNPNTQINIRCGINTGGCVAGVIGTKKFAYDLWGVSCQFILLLFE
ncbi:predicted protein [Naegleria gruberi]|uniref:Predicted protein n=1 Tax=Naegleria gruberi TaxID=5762 RepID=D2VQM4_NAEGR|nr:uncharacterized protein NAEGRDRAFT_71278 [Naegleria gruberi]EFC40898.1 predicted protein [Naegleria gruberi]|eukprot:XP_002673642.1 predicted protein [Naegleria gruberi strain NEG-M]